MTQSYHLSLTRLGKIERDDTILTGGAMGKQAIQHIACERAKWVNPSGGGLVGPVIQQSHFRESIL